MLRWPIEGLWVSVSKSNFHGVACMSLISACSNKVIAGCRAAPYVCRSCRGPCPCSCIPREGVRLTNSALLCLIPQTTDRLAFTIHRSLPPHPLETLRGPRHGWAAGAFLPLLSQRSSSPSPQVLSRTATTTTTSSLSVVLSISSKVHGDCAISGCAFRGTRLSIRSSC
jgi:hypothetical protein